MEMEIQAVIVVEGEPRHEPRGKKAAAVSVQLAILARLIYSRLHSRIAGQFVVPAAAFILVTYSPGCIAKLRLCSFRRALISNRSCFLGGSK